MTAETVKLTLEVPKGVIDFASDFLKFRGEEQPVKEFLRNELVGSITSIMQELPTTWFDWQRLARKYNLFEKK